MAKKALINRIADGAFFLDGAMGTQLMLAGVQTGGCNDYQNIESPGAVCGIHESYFRADCNAVLTNTLGANRYVLSRHGHSDKVREINLAAAQIARRTAGADGYVFGDIGPCGDFLEPLGTVKADELQTAFAEQAAALSEGGVDGFIVETMMGVSCADMIAQLAPLNVTAAGFNCGTLSMDGYIRLAKVFAEALKGSDMLLVAEPNAGKPELTDGKAVYSLSPADFAESMLEIHTTGAAILGGCCGTSPAHIEAMVTLIGKSSA